MLKIKQFVFNPFEVSTFLLIDEKTRQAAVVDPGMFTKEDLWQFDNYVKDNRLTITQIINTHMHVDHCFGDNYVKDKYGVKVAAHPLDNDYAQQLSAQARRFGIDRKMENVEIDTPLKDGDTITIGESKLQVLHVPGHSQGSIALYSKENNILLSGDALFRGSIGRTDFYGGNQRQLLESIRTKLLTLPDTTIVFPGHGRYTTIAQEKENNPFMKLI